MIEKQHDEMEDLLFTLSRTFDVKKETDGKRKRKIGLEDDVFEGSLIYIADMIRYSTRHAFVK